MSASMNDAAMEGNIDEVAMRLNMGEDVNQKLFPRYTTPLHDATVCGRTYVVELLIKRGADVNIVDYKNMTPLRLARRYGQVEIECMLVAEGAVEDVPCQKNVDTKANQDDVPPPWSVSSRKTSRMSVTS